MMGMISRSVGTLAIGAAMTGGLAGHSMAATPNQDPLNIILIMADDVGAYEFGCYGNTVNQTPRIDELAESGVRFETFFVTPVCSPTRVALMTGRRAPKTGWYNMRGRTPGGIGRQADLARDEVTYGQIFQRAGFSTAFAGKWQLTGDKLEYMLTDVGFMESLMWIYTGYLDDNQEYLGGFEGRGGNKASRYWQPGLARNGVHIPTAPDDYGPDMFVEFLTEFIERRSGQPFFIYYPMVLPHRPWVDTPDHQGLDTNSMEALKANVEYTDKLVGRIVDAVDENGIRDKTLIIFLGDNGTQTFGKGTATEWGARVPAIFNLPGRIQEGLVTNALAEVIDIFPTIADYAGIELAENLDLDGTSLRGVLEGTTSEHRDFIYTPLGHYRVLRDANWLLDANTPERFGKLFYTGDRRDGHGYADVTDIDHPLVNEARARMKGYMEQVPFPSYDPEERFDFENLTDHRINRLYEWVHRRGQRLGIETVSVPGIDPALIPSGPPFLEESEPGARDRVMTQAIDDEDEVHERVVTANREQRREARRQRQAMVDE